MKILLFILIAALLLGIFLPYGIENGIRNVPLLIIVGSVLFIILLVKFIKYILVLTKIKKTLRANGYEIEYFTVLPPFLRKDKRHHIVAKKGELKVSIFVLFVSKSYLTYKFNNVNSITLYKNTRSAQKGSRMYSGKISDTVETKKVGDIFMYWEEEELQNGINIVLFDKYPNLVKDAVSENGLGNGDKIYNKLFIYDLKGFERAVEEFDGRE